jgi:hypothetical protein
VASAATAPAETARREHRRRGDRAALLLMLAARDGAAAGSGGVTGPSLGFVPGALLGGSRCRSPRVDLAMSESKQPEGPFVATLQLLVTRWHPRFQNVTQTEIIDVMSISMLRAS